MVEAFGKERFPKIHHFNFEKTPSLAPIFAGDLDPMQILQALSLTGSGSIGPDDLVFLDEIQECPHAITSLKYFAESLPLQPVIAAGSHLGLARNESAFPVGKVEFLSLHPMSYFELLENLEPETHAFLLKEPLVAETPIQEFYHRRALHWLRLYLCVGGMPDAVRAAREIQKRLVEGYHEDFTKHSGVIPRKKGLEGIEGPLTWLERSRLIIKCHMANRFEQPLKAYLFDVGILNAMLDVPVESLLLETLGSFKGYLAENFVAQELYSSLDTPLTGWSEGESEVEFAVSHGAGLCPVEVKASSRSRRAKSLDALIARYHPELSLKLTEQNRGYSKKRGIATVPMYFAAKALERS